MDCGIYTLHGHIVNMPDFFAQPFFIYGANLFQQNDGILGQAI